MNIQGLNHHEESIPIRAREGSFDSAEEQRTDTREERRQELAQMTKGLRRMKRQLLLQHVEENHKPVASLRDLLMKAAYGGDSSLGTPPSSPRAHHLSSPSGTQSARME
mmetsp:Transcript_36901/g.103042  ORF Transcript_36901/g.103042 Transcript_36901/m.103042 type:complete len:109 (-) Transcript_36901:330-656(-)|eukprot:CAMPEP_0176186098 /NCGR_PEP_ID=MMETSP0121_2-20121125/1692_1 /TAXON_ID=160619 /ORGANISM="Kryptoperidinium foliaceum, Strain CCMP 1326" /LENGTH=108 /DNA_ID=CAMNT_0017524567 /DNA_START=22 /DNA_END=348 /DNA_ORIENTATION=+